MTISTRYRDFIDAKCALATYSVALVLDYVGQEAGGWLRWDVRRGGVIEPVGSLYMAPDGAVILRMRERR